MPSEVLVFTGKFDLVSEVHTVIPFIYAESGDFATDLALVALDQSPLGEDFFHPGILPQGRSSTIVAELG